MSLLILRSRGCLSGALALALFVVALLVLHLSQLAVHTKPNPRRNIAPPEPRDASQEKPTLKTVESRCPDDMLLNTTLYADAKSKSNYVIGSIPEYKDRIVILTPVSNSANRLNHYFSMLCSLNYPHHLISVALGEDSSTDKTFEIASSFALKMSPYFHSVNVFHFKERMKKVSVFSRHDPDFQLERRRHLAHSRNQLLSRGLQGEDWVLWIDSDVAYVPPDLIQHLLSANADVVAPSCLYRRAQGIHKVYDRNTWRETDKSRAFLKEQAPEYLMLEGYALSNRQYLPYLGHEGYVVDIDGVGGCALLVRADSHRKGLIFPPFVLDHHIETEGLAKMAAKMELSIKGLPFVNVFHV
jgi:hypothetical protein